MKIMLLARTKIGFLLLLVASLGAISAGIPRDQAARSALSHDEEVLKAAGISADGPALLDYFRRRTPGVQEQAALKRRAAELGSSVYLARARATDELIRAGRASLPYLRDSVKNKPDAETARRAQYCIGIIEQNTNLGVAVNAARVLVDRKPAGALDALLAYLPFADESWVEEEIRLALRDIAYADGKAVPRLEQALAAPAVKTRAAAAWLVGISPDGEQRKLAARLLSDGSSEVRFLTASALLQAREPIAAPALIALLTADSPELAGRAEDLLFRIAGDSGPDVWLDPSTNDAGARVRAAWEGWWKTHQARIDWNTLQIDEQTLGLTLVAENQRPDGAGRIFEINKNGDIRWQVKVANPIDAQWLPGRRILVADSRASQVYEMDIRGIIGWKHTGISPTSVQRLPNGNTVVSTYQKIHEITRDGRVVFTYSTQGHTYHARKMPGNQYVWIDACGEISQIDAAGKLLKRTRVGSGLAWGSIEPLRNGRFLVALGGIGKVQEMSIDGKVFWEKNVRNPNRAIRLANGHTLVASHGDSCVYEFDAAGNERWKHTTPGRPFAAHRR